MLWEFLLKLRHLAYIEIFLFTLEYFSLCFCQMLNIMCLSSHFCIFFIIWFFFTNRGSFRTYQDLSVHTGKFLFIFMLSWRHFSSYGLACIWMLFLIIWYFCLLWDISHRSQIFQLICLFVLKCNSQVLKGTSVNIWIFLACIGIFNTEAFLIMLRLFCGPLARIGIFWFPLEFFCDSSVRVGILELTLKYF